jgi:hypothetical protein
MMEENPQLHIVWCGPSAAPCVCKCPDGPCEHKWDGEWEEDELTASVTCSRCGSVKMGHDMWVGP